MGGYYADDPAFFQVAPVIARGATSDLSSAQAAAGGFDLDSISTNGGTGQNFSILLQGLFQAPASGMFTLVLASDDSAMLWGGGPALSPTSRRTALMDNGGKHWVQSVNASLPLEAGHWYPFAVAFGQAGGDYSLSVTVISPDGSTLSYPTSAFSHVPPPPHQPPSPRAA